MDKERDEIMGILVEIRDSLNHISVCFEDQYLEIRMRKHGKKVEAFEALLTDSRKRIFQLLFDQRNLSQVDIAQAAGVKQPAVSKFISLLIENDLIEQISDADKCIYRDNNDLCNILSK
jgi:predicted XRE-type DNA-binding protein